jgi:hypothetical protein
MHYLDTVYNLEPYIMEEIDSAVDLISEAKTTPIDIFNKYFRLGSSYAEKAASGGVEGVPTVIKARTKQEETNGAVDLFGANGKPLSEKIKLGEAVEVILITTLPDSLLLPVSISNKKLHLPARVFVHIKNLAKYGVTVQKESIKLKPSDLIETETEYDVEDLISAVKDHVDKDNDIEDDFKIIIGEFLDIAESGEANRYVVGAKKYETAITNYLGEILAPICLVREHFISGQVDDAEEYLLAPFNTKWSELKILFPGSKTNQLADSILKDDSVEIMVSSKAGRGAEASVKSMSDILARMDENEIDNIKTKYKDDYEDLDIIARSNFINGPLDLGIKYKIIKPKDKTFIQTAIKDKNPIPISLQKVAQLYSADTERIEYNSGYHLLAAVAHNVSKIINERKSFPDTIRAIMNKSSLVQLHMKVQSKGDSLAIRTFELKYPPRFDKKISLSAHKTYFASGSKGKYTFKLH